MAGMPGLVIRFGADTADALKGINRVEKALGRTLTPVEKLDRVTRNLDKAFIAAGVAAGAFALKVGTDAVKAALEEEKAMTGLAKTLENVGLAQFTSQTESMISSMQAATGVSDGEMRPAYERLVRSTRDIAEANSALKISLDAAAASGQTVETVSAAIAKGYDGNFKALKSLGLGLDSATLATKDMAVITAELARLTGGQAAAASETYAGRIAKIQVAADDASETIGFALLDAITDVTDALGGDAGATSAIEAGTDAITTYIKGVSAAASGLATLATKARNFATQAEDAADQTWYMTAADKALGAVARFAQGPVYQLGQRMVDQEQAAAISAGATYSAASAYSTAAQAANIAAQSIQRMNAYMAAGTTTTSELYFGGTPTAAYSKKWTTDTVLATREWADANREVAASLNGSGGGGGGGGGSVTSATKELTKAQQKQIDLMNRHVDKLARLKENLDAAAKAQTDYADSIASSLTSNIDIGAAWAAQIASEDNKKRLADALAAAIKGGDPETIRLATEEQAKAVAVTWGEAFAAQIEASKTFSAGLATLATGLGNTPGAQLLLDKIAGQGATVGNELLAGMSLETAKGYAASLQSAVDTANAAGVGVSSIFYGEGVTSALGMMTGMEETFAKDTERLKKMGKKIGDDIASGIKQAIKDALADIDAATAAYKPKTSSTSTYAGAPTYNITVTGAVDPVGVSRQIKRILAQGDLRGGRGV